MHWGGAWSLRSLYGCWSLLLGNSPGAQIFRTTRSCTLILSPLSPILNKGPATGEALAQLILEGRTHNVDITPFDPARSLRVLKHASFLDPYDGEYTTKFVPWFSSLHTWIDQLLFVQVFPQPGLIVGVVRRIVRQSKNSKKSLTGIYFRSE